MARDSGQAWSLRLACAVAAILLGAAASAHADPAEGSTMEQVRKIGSSGAGAMPAPVQSGKSARRPMRRDPDRSGNFVYGIINQIKAQSEELCARYGGPGDCLEEAEVCLTMRDNDDNQVKLCLNTVPGESKDGDGRVQRSRVRR